MKKKINKALSSSLPEINEELLLRYVEGKVSIPEKRLIEERLTEDPFLSDALEGLMTNTNLPKQRRILKEIKQSIQPRAGARMFKILPLWSVVQIASAMLLIIITAWFISYVLKKPGERIFAEHFKPYPAPVEIVFPPSDQSPIPLNKPDVDKNHNLRSTRSDRGEDLQLDKALTFYKDGKYIQAIFLFESILQTDTANEAAAFYCGVSYLATGDSDHALQKLKARDPEADSDFYEQTLWYQALAYIHKNEKAFAIPVLQRIVDLNSSYRHQAQSLMDQLK